MGALAPVLATVLGWGVIRTVTVVTVLTVSRARIVDALVANKSGGGVDIEEEGVENENEEGVANEVGVEVMESTGISPETLRALETELVCGA